MSPQNSPYNKQRTHWLCKLELHSMSPWDLLPTYLTDTFMWVRQCKRPGCNYHEESDR